MKKTFPNFRVSYVMMLVISTLFFKMEATGQCTNQNPFWTLKSTCGNIAPRGSLCSGSLYRFCNDSLVCIIDSTTDPVDYTYISWDDGSPIQVFAGHIVGQITHSYHCSQPCYNSWPFFWEAQIRFGVSRSCGQADSSFNYMIIPTDIYYPPKARFHLSQDTICVYESVFLVCNFCTNSATPVFRWYDNGVLFDTVPCPTLPLDTIPGTHIIRCSIENECGKDSLQDTLVVKPPTFIAPTLTSLDSCAPDTFYAHLNGMNVTSVTWSTSGPATISPIHNANPTGVTNDSGMVTINVTAVGCCLPNCPAAICNCSWDTTLHFQTGANPTLLGPLNYCQDSITITGNDIFLNTGSTITTYGWTFAGGNPPTSSSNNPSVTFNTLGAHLITLIAGSSCGIDTVTNTLTLSQQPQLNITTTSLTICSPDTVLFTDNSGLAQTYSWSAPGADAPNTSTASNPYFIYSTGGAYTVTATASNPSCIDATQTFNIQAADGADLTQLIPLPDSCIAFSLLFSDYFQLNSRPNDTAYLYQISDASGVVYSSTTNPPNPLSYSVNTPGTYTVIVKVWNTCDSVTITDQFSYTVPQPIVIPNDTVLCKQGAQFTLTATPVTGNWYYHDTLYGSGFFRTDTCVLQDHWLVYKYGSGTCEQKDSVNIQVRGYDVSAGPDVTLCNSTAPFDFTTAIPAGGIWTSQQNAITNSSAGTYDPLISYPNNDEVYYTTIDSGCTTIDTLLVNFFAAVTASFNIPDTECVGIDVAFDNPVDSSTALWLIDGANVNGNHVTHNFSSSGVYNISVTITDSVSGCTGTVSKNILILQPPDAAFTIDNHSGCDSLAVTVTDNSWQDSSVSYNWNFGSADFSPGTVYFHAGPGNVQFTYPVTLTATNRCSTAVFTDSITVFPQPMADFGTTFNDTCSPALVSFSDTSTGCPCSYSWFIHDSLFHTGYTPDDTLLLAGTADAVYSVHLEISNQCGMDSVTKQIVVHPNEVQAFFNTSTLYGCRPLDVTFTDFSLPNNCWYLKWNFDDTASAVNVTYGHQTVHTFADTGTYVIWHVADNHCGLDSVSQTINVFDQPNVSFHAPLIDCFNEAVQFVNTSEFLSSWTWDLGDGSFDSTNFSPVHSYPAIATYNIVLYGIATGNSTATCADTAYLTVQVVDNPTASFSIPDNDGCAPLKIDLTSNSTGASYLFWDTGTGDTLINSPNSYTYTTAGSYTVTLTVIDNNQCRDDTSFSYINVYPAPVSAFDPQPEVEPILTPDFTFINNTVDTSGVTPLYSWFFGDGATAGDFSPSHSYTAPGTYPVTLIVTNLYGCTDTTIRKVIVEPVVAIYVPNSFTPNGDGINDLFRAFYSDMKSVDMVIIDRWGLQIFECKNLEEGWDGTYNGKMCQRDVYEYRIEATDLQGVKKKLIGHVSLIK